MQSITTVRRALEFGIYRDGDNNLDRSQAVTLAQALQISRADRSIDFNVEDTSARNSDRLQTRTYTISDGAVHQARTSAAHDMASPANLARFVAQTLDQAQRAGAKQTWIELSDHGAGDGGGLEADSAKAIMSIDGIAGAIADGVALHAKAHPEDAGRRVDGVVANQCLMATLGFADELSHAGVRFLAASPETMLSPGTPTTAAPAIAEHTQDPKAMARAVVNAVMDFQYQAGGERWHPAAAFDVLDLSPTKWSHVEQSVKALNDIVAVSSPSTTRAVREDAGAIQGMVRFPHSDGMPWRADRPAIALYDLLTSDEKLSQDVRSAAHDAKVAVGATVLAHRESDDVAPFGDADYSDAAGPTVHFPVRPDQIDPWAPRVSETDNAFYRKVDGDRLARTIA